MMLATAIRNGDLAKVTELLRSELHIDRRAPDGLTPLMVAAGHGQSQMVELLLVAGADVLALEPRMGASALHKAAQSGNPDVIGLLLDHGAFIDQQSPVLGHTALMDAVMHRHSAAVRELLGRGARTMIRNHWQQTALDLARLEGLDVIARMIAGKDDEVAAQMTRLGWVAAIKAGDADTLQQSLADRAQIDGRIPRSSDPDDDYTPLGLAAREGRADCVHLLLDAGADPRRVVGLMRGTPVHEASYHGHAGAVRAMTERGDEHGAPKVELDAQGPYNGFTALHDAVWQGHEDVARALVEAGARLDIRSHAGLTPRDLALLYGHDSLAHLLHDADRG